MTLNKEKPLENTVWKGENAANQHFFSISHYVFYSIKDKFYYLFIYNSMCECNTILSAYTKYRHLG